MKGKYFILGYLLVKVMALVCKADGEPGLLGGFVMITTSNGSREEESVSEETPHTEEECRGYFDVMGQWDPPFICKTENYLYCCGTCGFRFCCSYKHSRLDQSTCKNYDTPVWMKTRETPFKKINKLHDSTKDKTNLIVYIICGVVAIMALVGIFTKLGLEKAHRPQRENMSRLVLAVLLGFLSLSLSLSLIGFHLFLSPNSRAALRSARLFGTCSITRTVWSARSAVLCSSLLDPRANAHKYTIRLPPWEEKKYTQKNAHQCTRPVAAVEIFHVSIE